MRRTIGDLNLKIKHMNLKDSDHHVKFHFCSSSIHDLLV